MVRGEGVIFEFLRPALRIFAEFVLLFLDFAFS
jgi:hypothetical protein